MNKKNIIMNNQPCFCDLGYYISDIFKCDLQPIEKNSFLFTVLYKNNNGSTIEIYMHKKEINKCKKCKNEAIHIIKKKK